MTTRATAPAAHSWPVGAFFLTWTKNEKGDRDIQYQGRVLAFDGEIVWAEPDSWINGSGQDVARMRRASLSMG